MQSQSLKFNREDIIAILKGASVAMLGAGLTYLSQEITKVDFGEMTPVVTAFWAILVNTLRKWIAGQN